jgi:hypothetical protein
MKKRTMLLMVLAAMCFASKEANADSLINIQFGYGEHPYEGGGAANNDTGRYWNLIDDYSYTGATLQYSNGDDSPVTYDFFLDGQLVGITPGNSLFEQDDIEQQSLMLGYAKNTLSDPLEPSNATITLYGLTPGTYEIYIYSQAEKNTKSELYATAKTSGVVYSIEMDTDGKAEQLEVNNNWMKATVAITDGTLTMSVNPGTVGLWNGFQIQPVPEPNSVILLGVGGLILFGRFKPKINGDCTITA